MVRGELQKLCRNAVVSGRKYLISCVENDTFYDKWFGTVVPPPVERSSSPMLCFFTALALRESGGIPATVKEKIRSTLLAAKKGDSYGYDVMAPIDADDTAFALRTLIVIGETVTPEMVTAALEPFRCGDSWFTFPVSGIDSVETPPFHSYYSGPASVNGPHPEVHLNIAALFLDAGMHVGHIPPIPLKNGLPISYFYNSSIYGAWLYSTVCRSMQLQYQTMKSALLRCRNEDGGWPGISSGFSTEQETALALLTLTNYGMLEKTMNGTIDFLLARRKGDGTFSGGVVWQYYLPENRKNSFWYAKDDMSIVATSLTVLSLQCGMISDGLGTN